ncbi:tripartite tricarboxylate transporter TctB family protein [Halalkalibacterium ligniniphilum]|uniref:tripartite tricarboxylate transporter TctB family protein n=1 Tax=Halalkalibacterium ligniniphilum TaxID=1134413 RepID=UPI00036C0673|nr:tripartite tricarboxylate transporter TctB family protein [Halalkalibacterium ligniniphilum]
MRISERSIFSLILIVTMGVFVALSFTFNPQARLFPLVVGGITFIMLIIQFFGDSVPSIARRFPFLRQEGVFSAPSNQDKQKSEQDEQVEEEQAKNEKSPWAAVATIILSIAGFIVILHFTSYLLAVLVFLFFVICILGKEKLIKSLGIAVLITGFMYVLFDLILNTRF